MQCLPNRPASMLSSQDVLRIGVNTLKNSRFAEAIVALILTGVAISLHGQFMVSAGALWRDEVSSFDQATFPDMKEVFAACKYDYFPMFLSFTLRTWWNLGLADTDFGLRVYGLLVGLATIGALWACAWMMGHTFPTVSIVLVGLSPFIVRTGDSIRAYGLGIFFGVLTFGTFYWMAKAPRWLNVVVATLSAVCAVQSLYQNAFFVFAAGLGAMVVCARHRQWKHVGLIAGVGAVAALSLVPYAITLVGIQSWSYRYPVSALEMLQVATKAMDSPNKAMLAFWVCGLAVGIYAVAERFAEQNRKNRDDSGTGTEYDDRIIYTLVFLSIATIGFLLFLYVAGVSPSPRHYLALVVMVAVCLDSLRGSSPMGAYARTAFAALALLMFTWPAWNGIQMRQTNMDAIAERLAQSTSEKDYIVVYPWYIAISFQRYYDGKAPWTSVPPLDDLRITRYDLLIERMTQIHVMDTVLERIHQTLSEGGSVWVVGGKLPELQPGEVVEDIEPAPHPVTGWSQGTYREHWARQIADVLRDKAGKGNSLTLPTDKPINRLERVRVTLFRQ